MIEQTTIIIIFPKVCLGEDGVGVVKFISKSVILYGGGLIFTSNINMFVYNYFIIIFLIYY